MTEDQWVEKRKGLVDCGKEQRECDQLPVLFEVRKKKFHY
jgi:hypothetical protein